MIKKNRVKNLVLITLLVSDTTGAIPSLSTSIHVMFTFRAASCGTITIIYIFYFASKQHNLILKKRKKYTHILYS